MTLLYWLWNILHFFQQTSNETQEWHFSQGKHPTRGHSSVSLSQTATAIVSKLSQSWTFGPFKVHNSNIFWPCSNSRTGHPESIPAPDSNRRVLLGSPWELTGFSFSLCRLSGSLHLGCNSTRSPSPLCCWHGKCREIWIWAWEEGRGQGRCILLLLLLEVVVVVLIILFWLLIGRKSKLNKFPQIKSVLLIIVFGEWSLPVLILTHELFLMLSVPCIAEEGR